MSKETEQEEKSSPFWGDDFKAITDSIKNPIEEEEENTKEDDLSKPEESTIGGTTIEEPKGVEEGTISDEKSADITSFLDDAVSLLDAEGLMFTDETKTYTPDAQGFKELIRDNMESYKSKLDAEYEQRLEEARNNIEKGGELKISEMDTENSEHAENMLIQYYAKTGWEQEEIEEKIQLLKELGTLSGEAKIAQRYLGKEEKALELEQAELASKTAAEEQAYIAEYITGIKTEIDRTEIIAGFALSNKDKAGFKDFLFKKDKTGETQAQKIANDPKHRLRVAFFEYMDYSKSDMEIKVRTELANEQAKKASRFTSTQMGAKGSTIVEPDPVDSGIKGFFAKNTLWDNTDED